tara:strand:+ start:1429 stop:1755 length:327 start_codon:yes stop_codon:yes gene_type:complete
MEITDKIVLRQPDWTARDAELGELPDRVKVRACTDKAKWMNIAIQQCEDEGRLFVGLASYHTAIDYTEGDISIQIAIEDIPVLIKAMQQAYEKQVIKEHQTKWSNNND